MSNAINQDHFVPSTEDLNKIADEVLEAATDGHWPFYMVENLGMPYFVVFNDGRDYECHPWLDVIDRFAAMDGDSKIHWMHPAMKSRITALALSGFLPEIEKGTNIEGLTINETAEVVDDHALLAILRLQRRQEVAGPVYDAISDLPPVGTPKSAENHLQEVFKDAGIKECLGWSLAQIALCVNRNGAYNPVHLCPLTRVQVLSKVTDPASAPCPSKQDALAALSALKIADNKSPDMLSVEIHLLALAGAHGMSLSELEEDEAVSDLGLTVARINRGDFDPSTKDLELGHPERSFETAVVNCLTRSEDLSAHGALHLIGSANIRLKTLGLQAQVDFASCKLKAKEEMEIPF